MSLFKITDLKRQEPAVKSKAITFEGKTSAVICKKNQKLQAVMYMPPDKGAVQFVSLGDWSTHDLLFYYLNITGPADVYFTTWSISEFAMRQLYAMVDSKLITSLSGQ